MEKERARADHFEEGSDELNELSEGAAAAAAEWCVYWGSHGTREAGRQQQKKKGEEVEIKKKKLYTQKEIDFSRRRASERKKTAQSDFTGIYVWCCVLFTLINRERHLIVHTHTHAALSLWWWSSVL
jgi:hypothetical protein